MTPDNFADRLISRMSDVETPCIVGLDPVVELLPAFIRREISPASGRSSEAMWISAFNEIVIDACSSLVAAVKPQLAFYEQYGLGGLEAFANTLRMAKGAGLICIADAKRGDIGSTAAAYAKAYLGNPKTASDFEVDAMTVSPFLGFETLEPFVRACDENGKGLFIIARTSNPGVGDVQQARTDQGYSVSEGVCRYIAKVGRDLVGSLGYSSIGAVLGATHPQEASALREVIPQSLILVPGYGTQGGTARGSVAALERERFGGVVSASRSITQTPSVIESRSEAELRGAIVDNVLGMITEIKSALDVDES